MLIRELGVAEMNEMGTGIHHGTLNISHDSEQPRRWRCASGRTLKMQKWQICLLH